MIGQTAGRIVVFYFARCHEDLRWYLSIHSTDALKTAANDTADNVRNLPPPAPQGCRLRLVKQPLDAR